MIQGIFVAICVFVALVFMGRRFYRTLTQRGCSDSCNKTCQSRECSGGGLCPHQKNLIEIKPGKKSGS